MNTPVTTRLNFKLMNEHDWPLLHELDQDPAVMKYINRGTPSTLKQIKEIVSIYPMTELFKNVYTK